MKNNKIWISLLLLATLLFPACTSEKKTETTEESESITDETLQTTEENILVDINDMVTYTAKDLQELETKSGKRAAISIDIVCQLCTGINRKGIDSMLRSIKSMGVSRVYLILCSPSYPLMSGGDITASKTGLTSSRVAQSLDDLGDDPNKLFIETCHKYGMEAIATIKPYEGGGGVTIPEGTTLAEAVSQYAEEATPECIGGYRAFMDSFIAEHPEMRVKRKENSGETETETITDVVLYYYYNGGSFPSDNELANWAKQTKNKPTLWVSEDNATYTPYTDYTFTFTSDSSYQVTDVNGNYIMTKKAVRVKLHINGLSENQKYVAITWEKDSFVMDGNWYQRPYSMTHLYHNGTELASTLGYYVRKPYDKDTFVPGAYTSPVAGNTAKGITVEAGKPVVTYKSEGTTGLEDFITYGFEYEYVYTSAVVNGFLSPVIALARGKNEYVQGLLCEGYEEVREYWLSQVRTALDYGADGIDIRWDGHSSMCSDYYYYGYNTPIIEEYQKQYGKNLQDEPVNLETATRVMKIRGEFFRIFLTDASDLTHKAGKLFLSHFFATSYNTDKNGNLIIGDGANQCGQWKMPKIIVEDYRAVIDLCDEIIYKDYFTDSYTSADKSQGQILTDYAKETGKKIWIHCYIQQSPQQQNDTFLYSFQKWKNVDGVTFYEITASFDYNTTGDYIAKYVEDNGGYEITVMNRIKGIAVGTTASELLHNLHFLGTAYVSDADGNSVPLDTVLTKDMLLHFGDVTFTFGFQ